MLVLDSERKERIVNGKNYLKLGKKINYPKERFEHLWEAWETGKRPNGYDIFEANGGKTFTYYTALFVGEEKLGVIAVGVEISTVTHGIFMATLRNMLIVGSILILFMFFLISSFLPTIPIIAVAINVLVGILCLQAACREGNHRLIVDADRCLCVDEKGNVTNNSGVPYNRPTYLHKLSCGAGCLFPPHSLHEEVFREDKFMTLAPTNDDHWFWLMGVLNGRRMNAVENNIDSLNCIPNTQDVGLIQVNHIIDNQFYNQLDNILNAYPLLREILSYEQRLANGQ